MPLELKLKIKTTVPIEVEGITPDRLCELSPDQIQRLDVFHGNQKIALADAFDTQGDAGDRVIEFQGDMSGVHWIGAGMQSGSIVVNGPAGRHLGSEMKGGRIVVHGHAGDWVGAEMKGGFIVVHGDAGHLVGAAYRGSARGMTKGTILIHGSAGNEIAHTMRRGLIAVGGDVGDLAAFNMLAGTLLMFGGCGIRHGAGMRRGTLAFFGAQRPPLLPSFRFACRYRPLMLALLLQFLEQHQFPLPDGCRQAIYELYHGDLIEGGRGELLIRTGQQ